jgi:cytochrome bd-type quinol oxidase subunit 2
MRREIPLFITFIIGTALVVAMFIPHAPFPTLDSEFSVWFDIIAVFAFILGGGNLLQVHVDRITRKHRDRWYSVVTIAGFLITLAIGLLKFGGDPGLKGNYIADGTWFKVIYDGVFTPLVATMFSLLAFFVASASYRAFRAKTREATVLLVAAFIILVGRTPIGYYLTYWLPKPLQFLHIPNLSAWILATPNLAGQRAIMIGIALGVIATSLKLILGIERSYLGREK